MLPVDGMQLENVKGELLKLKKKEAADCNYGITWPGQKSGRNRRTKKSRLSDMAQRGQERRAEETEEQRNRQLVIMAQRGQERRAEGANEQRNSRLSAMLQHARERRLNFIEGQNHHQIQTFYTARTVLN
ncbi:hypothetical protein AVEN_99116-1 [Araneus ventricosus]|uniref:STPR domain-containing protein n=1 Tax=Araneus ventricosus TaxID=182803 RepID=A0A4Y2Q6G3_ARAVE|nr:hypothetical protein AVEN_99116-1 [Araneus ventricosus]